MSRYRPYRRYASRRSAQSWSRTFSDAERTGDYTPVWGAFFALAGVLAASAIGVGVYLYIRTPVVPAWAYPVVTITAVILVIIAVVLGVGTFLSSRAAAEQRKAIPGTWQYAEVMTREWLVMLGERDARVGPGTHDGGVDVESSRFVVQVKHWQANVGGPAVRQIFGVAAARGKTAVVVALSGFTRDAESFAEEAGVALFSYASGEIRPTNRPAFRMVRAAR